MSNRTALNEQYKGLVESFSIPAELHRRDDGTVFASVGSAVPIHCCTPEEVAARAATTHHYCDVFTDELLAPLSELAYVRLDDNTAEKVFINRTKRLLLLSHDGRVAQWRAAASFESANRLVAGTPVVDQAGRLVSVLTARRGNHYAVSTFEGEGGYFETSEPWQTVEVPEGSLVYGLHTFPTREELRVHLERLPEGEGEGRQGEALRPALVVSRPPRVALVAAGGRQLAHVYLPHNVHTDVEYL